MRLMTTDITVIIGPTAIGKTDYSISLAKDLGAEIISADAFQVYRGLDIGTGKVRPQEMQGVLHHLIDIKNPDEPYSVSEFLSLSNAIIDSCRSRSIPIIICGGTAMYLRAFLYGYNVLDNTPSSPEIRTELEVLKKQKGLQFLWDELLAVDPMSAARIHPNDAHRIIRHLEIYRATGSTASSQRYQSSEMRQDVKIIGLNAKRSIVYDRINKRVDMMIEQGLINEVETLTQHYPTESPAFNAIGYKESILYLNSSISYEEMIVLLKKKTRHYAKHQLTWFKKFDNVHWTETP